MDKVSMNGKAFPLTESENELFGDLERVLYTQEQIAERVQVLGRQISEDYRDKQLVLISILKGGIVFLADLMRSITIPHAFDLVGASSYRGATKTTGKVIITKDVTLDLHGKHLLLVEDILDTGTVYRIPFPAVIVTSASWSVSETSLSCSLTYLAAFRPAFSASWDT
jgi:pyrimidine operon attenuation protein/uracil phosphoribosyltransferase